jgi:AmmeMemoRadiSam system protein B
MPYAGFLKREDMMVRRRRSLPRGWYPFEGKDCRDDIESYLKGWAPPADLPEERRGGIVPHAGWYFSGKLAARVFSSLGAKRKVELVVLYGGHLGPGDLPRIIVEESCETPLGDIETHQGFLDLLSKRVEMSKESPSSGDNTVEIQLAMVKYFFPDTKMLAIRSPLSSKAVSLGKEVAGIAIEKGIAIAAVASTDLTHYGPNYGFMNKGTGPDSVQWVKNVNDRGFIDLALKLDGDGLLKHALAHGSACSAGAAASAAATSKALGAQSGILLDYYTSYDIMPDDSFVGYAGIVY